MLLFNSLRCASKGIWYIRDYHPYNSGKQDEFDRMIMNLKNYESEGWKQRKQKEAENHFFERLTKIINTNYPAKILVCYIPRSSVGAESHIGNVAKRLCLTMDLIDGTECLYRICNITTAHTTGIRNDGRHLRSIQIKNKHLIRNSSVLLLDDVITTGQSMSECGMLLLNEGAKEVIGLGMGLTV